VIRDLEGVSNHPPVNHESRITNQKSKDSARSFRSRTYVKTVIKLLIAFAIINATARVGFAAAKYYQLKDQSQELVTFGGHTLPGELQNQILEKAEALELPLNVEDIQVTREGMHTTATAAYTQSVEVFPNYKYPIKFQFTVDGINMGAGVSPGGNPLRNR
jgi:hypothetical protein